MSSPRAQTSRKSTITQQPHHASAEVSASAAVCACCPQCHNVQGKYYCSSCLSERLIWQHANHRRLREERQRARSRVEGRLGSSESTVDILSQKDASDPFQEPTVRNPSSRKLSSPLPSAHYGASHLDRTARATIARLQSNIEQNSEDSQSRRKRAIEGKRRLEEKRQDLTRRRSLLETAQMSLLGFVETEAQERELFSQEKVHGISRLILELKEEGRQVAEDVAKLRAKLAREAYFLFDVRPPSSSLANARAYPSDSKGAATTGRNQRSKERYSAGAFAIDFTNAFDLGRSLRESKPKEEVGNANDWTIMGLVLPVPSDVKRFDRNEVNGAISHTVQMLQLVTSYLGITLPFVFSIQGDIPFIRANRLWGAGARESLHLSASTHSAFVATSGAATMGGMGASMMSNLGASTLSTLESFVQLPSGKTLPWARNSAEPVVKGTEGDEESNSNEEGVSTDDAANLGEKHFFSALTMLSYDVAYVAHLQGVKVDLIMAAGSSLRLLFKGIQSAELGKRSHASHHPSSNVSNLQFPSLDFAQLLQVHEPGSNARNESLLRQHSSKPIMEGSYVDAKNAAESILNIQQQHSIAKGKVSLPNKSLTRQDHPSPSSNILKPEKMSSLAAKRIPSTLPTQQKPKEKTATQAVRSPIPAKVNSSLPPPPPTPTLDFLRARGQKEQRSTSSTSSKAAADAEKKVRPFPGADNATVPPASGTITFNGREIRGKAKTPSSKAGKAKGDDDGWQVL